MEEEKKINDARIFAITILILLFVLPTFILIFMRFKYNKTFTFPKDIINLLTYSYSPWISVLHTYFTRKSILKYVKV